MNCCEAAREEDQARVVLCCCAAQAHCSRTRAMGRSPCYERDRLKKGPWMPEEDQKLLAYIEQHGHGCWRSLPAKAGELDRKLVLVIVVLGGPASGVRLLRCLVLLLRN